MNTFFPVRRRGGIALWVLLVCVAWPGLATPALAQASPPRPGTAPAQPDGTALQWLSVVLVSADVEAGAGGDAGEIPPAVQRVLADVADFLPFRSYRLHDAGLVGSSGGTIRLRGGGAGVFEVTLGAPARVSLDSSSPPAIGLRLPFTLTEIASTNTDVLRTSVTLAAGETVVVGTSRVRGQGLIAFITAVPSTSSAR